MHATIAGLDYDSLVVEFNVRPQPGTSPNVVLFRVQKGIAGLQILDVQPDNQGTKQPDGDVYQWFKLRFPDGQEGWLRSHVLLIEGDLTRFGYGMIKTAMYAYKLRRMIAEPSPTPPAPAVPEPAPVPVTPAPAPVDEVDDLCAGRVTVGAGARLRREPVLGEPIMVVPHEAVVRVLNILTIPGQRFRWVRVRYEDTEGWTREDLLEFSGDCARFDLEMTSPVAAQPVEYLEYNDLALYPVPMQNYRFVRGFTGHQPNHPGVDFGGDVGELMLAGPVGGLVVASVECKKCNVPGRPSTALQGLGLANPAVFIDPDWNFGYGHYVIVRYLCHQLPVPTRDRLTAMGMPGWHIYAMYAHLSRRDVETGDVLAPNQAIGACGNTGNSSGPHVHLELRASRSSNFTHWATLRNGLVDPLIMFER